MTICIAAIGKDGDNSEAIVFATDHMVSLPQIGQFEMPVEKYKKITDNSIAMLAGESLLFNDIIGSCNNCSFDPMKEKIRQKMLNIKEERIQKQLLDTYKLNYIDIIGLLKNPLQNPFSMNIMDSISKYTLNTLILLIGFKDNKAQIVEITENRIGEARDIGFDAIGSGGMQAMNTLLFQKHSKNDSLAATLYDVYKAKRNAEVAVGVGKETDIMILRETGVEKIDEDKVRTLSDIYNEELKFGKNNERLKNVVKKITYGEL
jgi:hypothetical protein